MSHSLISNRHHRMSSWRIKYHQTLPSTLSLTSLRNCTIHHQHLQNQRHSRTTHSPMCHRLTPVDSTPVLPWAATHSAVRLKDRTRSAASRWVATHLVDNQWEEIHSEECLWDNPWAVSQWDSTLVSLWAVCKWAANQWASRWEACQWVNRWAACSNQWEDNQVCSQQSRNQLAETTLSTYSVKRVS